VRRALLFDYDGIIVDSESVIGRVLIEVFAAKGVTITFDDFGHLLGTTGPDNDARWDAFTRSMLGPDVDLAELETSMTPAIREAIGRLTVLPGVRDLIDAARTAGWALGLGTGNTGPLDDYLARLELGDAFDAVVRTHGSGLAAKPAPDVFLTLAERLGVRPSDCVVLEDSVPGAEAAIAAGMAVVVCPCEATRACTFPDGVRRVSSLEELTISSLEQLMITLASAQPRR
jgi:HAD superfamily hydrolase (TIGR01509 family)